MYVAENILFFVSLIKILIRRNAHRTKITHKKSCPKKGRQTIIDPIKMVELHAPTHTHTQFLFFLDNFNVEIIVLAI